jgi:hypothetical protein
MYLNAIVAAMLITLLNRHSSLMTFFICIALGVNANYLYYIQAKRRIKREKQMHKDDDEFKSSLSRAGGTNLWGVLFAFILISAIVFFQVNY